MGDDKTPGQALLPGPCEIDGSFHRFAVPGDINDEPAGTQGRRAHKFHIGHLDHAVRQLRAGGNAAQFHNAESIHVILTDPW